MDSSKKKAKAGKTKLKSKNHAKGPSQTQIKVETQSEKVPQSYPSPSPDVFQQLWSGIAQLQQETGTNTQVVKEKEREIEQLQEEIADLTSRIETAEEERKCAINEYKSFKDCHVKKEAQLQKQLDQNNHEAKLLIEELSNSREEAIAQIKILTRTNKEVERRAEEDRKTVGVTESKLNEKLELVKKLRDELEKEKKLKANQSHQFLEKNALLTAENKRLYEEKEESSRHLWNVTDQVRLLKVDLQQTLELREKAEARTRHLEATIDKINKEKSSDVESIQKQLAAFQKKDSQLRKELENAKKEIDSLTSTAADDQIESEKVIRILRNDIKKKDGSLEEATRKLQASSEHIKKIKKDCDDKLNKMRNAIRTVQDKHLNDAINFDKERKRLEDKTKQMEESEKRNMSTIKELENNVSMLQSSIERTKSELNSNKKGLRAEYEAENKKRIAEIVTKHLKIQDDMQLAITETKASARREVAAVLERLDETEEKLSCLENENQGKLQQLDLNIKQLTETLRISEEEKDKYLNMVNQLEAQLIADKNNYNTHESKLQKALVASQQELSTIQQERSDENQRLRAEIEKERKRAIEAENEKRDLIIECQKLNDEAASGANSTREAERKIAEANEAYTRLTEEINRLKREQKINEDDAENRIDILQKEIENHVNSRRESLMLSETMRNELKIAKKEAAESVNMFSKNIAKITEERAALEVELDEVKSKLKDKIEIANDAETEKNKVQSRLNSINDVHSKEIADLLSQLEAAESNYKAVQADHNQVIQTISGKDSEIQSLETKVKKANQEVKQIKSILAEAERTKQDTFERLARESEQCRLLRTEISRRKEDFQQIEKEVIEIRNEKHATERQFRTREAFLLKDVTNLQAEVQQRESELSSTKGQLTDTQNKLSAVQEAANKTIKQLMEEIKSAEKIHSDSVKILRTKVKDEHNQFLDMQNERESESKRYAIDRKNLDAQIDKQRDEIASMKRQRDEILQELSDTQNECDEFKSQVEAGKEVVQVLKRRLSSAEEVKGILETELKQEKENVSKVQIELQESSAKSRAELRAEEKAHELCKSELEAVKREKEWSGNESSIRLAALSRQVSNFETDMKRKAEEVESLQKKLRDAQNESTELQEAANKTISSLRNDQNLKFQSLEKELEESRSESAQAAELCVQMEQDRAVLQHRIQELHRTADKAQDEAKLAQNEQKTAVERYQAVVQDKRRAEAELKKLRFQIGTINQDGMEDISNLRKQLSDSQHDLETINRNHESKVRSLNSEIESLRDIVNDLTNKLEEVDEEKISRETSERMRTAEEAASSYFSTNVETESLDTNDMNSLGLVLPSPSQMDNDRRNETPESDMCADTAEMENVSSSFAESKGETSYDSSIQNTAEFLRARKKKSERLKDGGIIPRISSNKGSLLKLPNAKGAKETNQTPGSSVSIRSGTPNSRTGTNNNSTTKLPRVSLSRGSETD